MSEKKTNNDNMIVGIACYKRDQWKSLMTSAVDSKNLESTWKDWQTSKNKLKKELESKGLNVKDILIDIRELNEYCRAQNLPNNSKTRSKYVTDLLNESI